MDSRTVLIRTLDYLQENKYLSGSAALTTGAQSTAVIIANSFDIRPDLSDEELATHGPEADLIINWITSPSIPASDEYLNKCKAAVTADTVHYGYVCSIIPAYRRYMINRSGIDKITKPNAFARDPGEILITTCEVVNLQKYEEYSKLSMVDPDGHLITYCENSTNKQKMLRGLAIGDKVSISSKVARNKFSTPFETTLTRPKIEKIS
jgi:hypothetical protein